MVHVALLALGLALASDAAYVPDGSGPPNGTPEDQQLWRDLQAGTADAFAAVGRVNQGAFRVRYTKYDEELGARGMAPEVAAEAASLRKRVADAMQAALSAIPEDGGRIRACRYAMLHFEQRMPELHDPAIAREMPEFRAEAQRCAKRMQDLVAAVAPRADALESALADADAFLVRVPRATPAAETKAATPAPEIR